MNADDGASQTIAIRLQRLAVPVAKSRIPTYEKLGLEALVREATRWQQLRSTGLAWGMAAMRKAEPDRWVELANLFGSTGESALLAASAEVEIELLRGAIRDRTVSREYGISQRFFAEAQGQQVLGTGHRLANVVARALMADSNYPWGTRALGGISGRFPSESVDRSHWIAISRAGDLGRTAQASGVQSLERMARSLEQLRKSSEWRALEDQRGSDFHRARHESPYFAHMTFSVEAGKKTISVYGSPSADDPAPQGRVEGICQISRSALNLLLPAMKGIRLGWTSASRILA